MYDFNPFREIKKLSEESEFMKQVNFVMDPVFAKYNNDAKNRESMRADIVKKRKHHEEMVRKGELTQSEFERLEKMGEFSIKEAAEREFDDFDVGPQSEEMPGREDYDAKEENDQHNNTIKDKLLAYLNQKPNDPATRQVHSEIHRAKIHSNPHEQDSSVVRVAGHTFIVPHGHSPHIKVVS